MKLYKVLKGRFQNRSAGATFRDNYTRAHKLAVAAGTLEVLDGAEETISTDGDNAALKEELAKAQGELADTQKKLEKADSDNAAPKEELAKVTKKK